MQEDYEFDWENLPRRDAMEAIGFVLRSVTQGLEIYCPTASNPIVSVGKDHTKRFNDEWTSVMFWIRTKHEEV